MRSPSVLTENGMTFLVFGKDRTITYPYGVPDRWQLEMSTNEFKEWIIDMYKSYDCENYERDEDEDD